MAQWVHQSLALGAVVGDFRGLECQIGLSRPGDSSLPLPVSPLPISHPGSLPPSVAQEPHNELGCMNHSLGYLPLRTGEAKMGKGQVQKQKVWGDPAGCSQNTGIYFPQVNESPLYRLAPFLLVTKESMTHFLHAYFYGNDVQIPSVLNWLLVINEPPQERW